MASFVDMVRIVLFLVYLSTLHCDGFRIRRSGLAGFNDPYALSNAYSDIERRRRRTDYGPLVLDEDDSYFNPNDLEENEEYLMSSPYLDEAENIPNYYADYRFKQPLPSYRGVNRFPYSYGNLEKPVYAQQKGLSHKSHAFKRMGQSSLNELRKIFASADVPEKRLAPVKRQEPVKSLNTYDEEPQSELKQTKDLISKVRAILAAAEKLSIEQEKQGNADNNQAPVDEEDVVVEAMSPDGNTKVEQEDITAMSKSDNGDAGEDEISDNDDSVDEDENEVDDDEASEDENTDDAEISQSKSKRASSQFDNEGYVRDLEAEISSLRDELIRLQLLQILEDKENDFLANALKFATLDQLHDDDKLVLKEYDDISKATDTEELIQQIRDDVDDDELTSEAAASLDQYLPSGIDSTENEVKRSELTPDENGYYDGPVEERISYAGPIEDNFRLEDMSSNKGVEVPITVPYPDDSDEIANEIEEEENEKEAVEEVAAAMNEELEKESENEEKKVALQNILQSLNKDEMQDLIMELKYANDRRQDEAVSDVCLPVVELSQNCAFADTLGIPIDDEARDLCSRHQMCYTCGATIGIPRIGCNDGYKGTVIEACKDDTNCIRQSAVFLRLMEKYHQYEAESPDECSDICVEDFIMGEE